MSDSALLFMFHMDHAVPDEIAALHILQFSVTMQRCSCQGQLLHPSACDVQGILSALLLKNLTQFLS